MDLTPNKYLIVWNHIGNTAKAFRCAAVWNWCIITLFRWYTKTNFIACFLFPAVINSLDICSVMTGRWCQQYSVIFETGYVFTTSVTLFLLERISVSTHCFVSWTHCYTALSHWLWPDCIDCTKCMCVAVSSTAPLTSNKIQFVVCSCLIWG